MSALKNRSIKVWGPTIWAVIGVGLVAMLTLQYSYGSWRTNLHRYAFAMEQVKDCRINLAEAHLWFEEILTGDQYLTIEQVWDLISSSENAVKALINGTDADPEPMRQILDNPVLLDQAKEMQKSISTFRNLAKTRWAQRGQAGIGSALDQEYDKIYHHLAEMAQDIETDVIAAREKMVLNQFRLHLLLIGLLAFTFLLVVTGLVINGMQRKKAEQQRAILEDQLIQSQKMEAIGTMAGGIAHDFNNILAAILGYAELALGKSTKDHDNTAEISKVIQASQRASNLIKQILTFSRKSDLDFQVLDINRGIAQAVDMARHSLPRMIDFQLDLSPDASKVRIDPNQLEQVVLNLCTNAADAMPDGGSISIETQNVDLDRDYVDRHLEVQSGEYVLMQVSDTGIGMDKDTRDRIFDPFFTTKDVGQGTGLGLATVFGIVKRHSGHVTCYSELGNGTVFKIYWPVWTRGPEYMESPEPEQSADITPAKSSTILLVDDEMELREVGRRLLVGHGYEVLAADSGEKALQIMEQHGPKVDLVILDLSMPGMGGHKCLVKLKELYPQLPVVITSGYSLNGNLKEVMADGAEDFISKPFRVSVLSATISRILSDNHKEAS